MIGSDDDDILRTGGSECKPGKSFLPLAIGDIKGSLVASNLLYYVADKQKFAPGEAMVLDVGNRDEKVE